MHEICCIVDDFCVQFVKTYSESHFVVMKGIKILYEYRYNVYVELSNVAFGHILLLIYIMLNI